MDSDGIRLGAERVAEAVRIQAVEAAGDRAVLPCGGTQCHSGSDAGQTQAPPSADCAAGHDSSNFVSPIKFGYIDLENFPKYDPAEAQRLLAEAGYPNGEGLPELEYITSTGFYPKTKEYGELITAMLQEQGFPVTLNVMEVAAWNERLYDRPGGGPGHMIDCGWTSASPEPDLVLRTHFHSSSKRICGIVDPEIDAALDAERYLDGLAEQGK